MDPLILDVSDFAIVVSDVGVLPTVKAPEKPPAEFLAEFHGGVGDEFMVDKSYDADLKRNITKIYCMREIAPFQMKKKIGIVKITKLA